MNRASGIVSLALAATWAGAQVPPATDMHRAFTEAIADGEAVAQKWSPRPTDGTSYPRRMDVTPPKEIGVFARPLSAARPEGVDPRPYRLALIAALHDKNPKVRGMACWVAGLCFDLELVPHLAALLDDAEPSLAVPAPSPQQAAPNAGGKVDLMRPTVGWMARQALIPMTTVSFASKADFDRWSAASKPVRHKLWYWVAKWFHLYYAHYASAYGVEGNLVPKPAPVRIDAEFEALPVDVAMKILPWSSDALYAELKQDLRLEQLAQSGSSTEIYPDRVIWPTDEEIGAYVVRHELSAKLMAALEDPSTPVEFGLSQPPLARMAAEVGRWVFGPRDDARLAKAQERHKGTVIGERLAATRSYILPDRALPILTQYVVSTKDASLAASELASRFGSRGEAALIPYFRDADGWMRTHLTEVLRNAASRGVAVDRAFLLKLVQTPSPEKSADTDDSLPNLASIANVVLGREAIAEADIQAALYKRGKMSHEDLETANAGRPEALRRLRSLLEQVLSA